MEKPSQGEPSKNAPRKTLWNYLKRTWSNDDDTRVPVEDRRTFLKRSGIALAGVVAPDLLNFTSPIVEQKEKEQIPISTAFLDFSFQDTREVIAGNEEFRLKAYEVNTAYFKEHRDEYFMSTEEDLIQIAIVDDLLRNLKGHETLTTNTFRKMADHTNRNMETPQISPVEKCLRFHFATDDLGNITATMTMDPESLAKIIRKLPKNQRIINMSLLVGDGKVQYVFRSAKDLPKFEYTDPENPNNTWYFLEDPSKLLTPDEYAVLNAAYKKKSIEDYKKNGDSDGIVPIQSEGTADTQLGFSTTPIDAYSEELAPSNLKKLIDLARQFPEKTFICAGGNENERFYHARKAIEAESPWSENLLVIGVRSQNLRGSTVRADGCDLYLDEQDFTWLNDGGFLSASEATAVVSSVANSIDARLQDSSLSESERSQKVREVLRKELTEKSTYTILENSAKNEETLVTRECSVFRIEKYEQWLKGKLNI